MREDKKMLLRVTTAAGEKPSVAYVLVVDDHAVLTGGTVSAQMLLDAPVAAPAAQNTTTATARGKQGFTARQMSAAK